MIPSSHYVWQKHAGKSSFDISIHTNKKQSTLTHWHDRTTWKKHRIELEELTEQNQLYYNSCTIIAYLCLVAKISSQQDWNCVRSVRGKSEGASLSGPQKHSTHSGVSAAWVAGVWRGQRLPWAKLRCSKTKVGSVSWSGGDDIHWRSLRHRSSGESEDGWFTFVEIG